MIYPSPIFEWKRPFSLEVHANEFVEKIGATGFGYIDTH